MIQGGHCQPCPNGFMPNENRSRCVSIDEQIIDYRNPWAAGSMAFALFGKHLHCSDCCCRYMFIIPMTPDFAYIYICTNAHITSLWATHNAQGLSILKKKGWNNFRI